MKPDDVRSRRASPVEAVTNVVVGYLLALLIQRAVFPVFDILTTIAENSLIVALFAAASLGRS